MAKNATNIQSQSLDEQPIVLLLSDNYSYYLNELAEFLVVKNLEVVKFTLEDLKDKKELVKKYHQLENRQIYKIIVSYGFLGYQKTDFQLILDFLLALSELQPDSNFLFLSAYSSPFKLLEVTNINLEEEFNNQGNYLSLIKVNFNAASFYLAQDLLLNYQTLPSSIKLCLASTDRQILLDPNLNFHWQSKEQWLNFLEEQVLKPVRAERILLRGRQEKSSQFISNLEQLLNRYFQLDLKISPCLTEKTTKDFVLKGFTKVTKVDKEVKVVIDQWIREFPKLKSQLNLEFSTPTIKADKKVVTSARTVVKKPLPIKKNRLELENKKKLKTASKVRVVNKVKPKYKEIIENNNIDEKIDKSSNIDEEIKRIFKEERQEEKQGRIKSNLKSNRQIIKKTKKRKLLFYVGAVVFSFGFLLLSILASFYFSQMRLKTLISQGSGERAYQSRLVYKIFSWEVGKAEGLLGEEQLSSGREVLDLALFLDEQNSVQGVILDSFYLLYQDMLRGDGDLNVIWRDLEEKLGENLRVSEELNSFFSELNFDILSEKEANSMMLLNEKNQERLRFLTRLNNVFVPLRDLIMSPARTKVAILFQDDSELRSSGGFLSSVLLLSFERGFLIDEQVLSVADLDNRLYGEREINGELQALFGGEKLLFRDSNFNPDFSEASQEINWFLEQSSGSKSDILITLKSSDIQNLLEILGELKVENSQGKVLIVNSLNIFEQLEENWLEDNQKTTDRFYEKLVQALWVKISNLSSDKLLSVGRYLMEELEKKEIYITSSEAELNEELVANLWTGKRLNTLCPSQFQQAAGGCFLDGIYQVENNLSLNKVNRYLKQDIKHSVGISENFIRHKRVIHYQNFARQSSWPQGDYLAYLKFYLPQTANIEKIKVAGELLGEGDYLTKTEGDNLVLSFKVTVPVKKELDVELVYLLEHDLNVPFSYAFLEQKQAGIFEKNIDYSIVFAEEFKPRLIAPQADYSEQVINFKNKNLDHFVFALSFD